MSPAPKPQKNSPAAHEAVLPPPMTAEQIAAEERIKAQMVASFSAQHEAAQAKLAGVKAATPAPRSLDDTIAQLAAEAAAAEAARMKSRRDVNRTINEPQITPLVNRLNAAKSELRKLREKHLAALEDVARMDVGAMVRAYKWKITPYTPGNVELGIPSSGGISDSTYVALLQRAAATGVTALGHNFMVSDDAVRRAQGSAGAEFMSQEFIGVMQWLRKQVSTSESAVTAAKGAIANVEKLKVKLQAALAEATKIELPTLPPDVEYLPDIKTRPKKDDSSFVDFDPRLPIGPQLPKAEPEQRNPFRMPEGPSRVGKIVGVEGGA